MKFKGIELVGTYKTECFENDFEIHDSKGKIIYYENDEGGWYKKAYDEQGNTIYFENSNGSWNKQEYDAQGNEIYIENRNGIIKDDRPKIELTLQEIADKFGIEVSKLKIKEEYNEN